jgi:hypothetical protein
MSFKETRVFEWLTIGISAAAFILALKLVVMPLKIPGLTQVIATL